ncbi:MAG: purine-nucleoside phosphorylase [Eubacteriales bacterium]|nr:purine-nucleoside phosphorylase [Eubacteriales bacterium]
MTLAERVTEYRKQCREAANWIAQRLVKIPDVAVILGSGLGAVAAGLEEAVKIPYERIPYFPRSTVEGHAGMLLAGRWGERQVLLFQGRFHYYEGYSMEQVAMPVRVMALLGVKKLIVTNAAGGINASFQPGDLMLISDHINLMGTNPLIGPNWEEIGPRFPDMTEAYSSRLRAKARKVGEEIGIFFREGVYAGLTGPTYETPAEIRFLRTIGADAVGMSTVPEVITAVHAGIEVLGISTITNLAAGISEKKLSHEEVIEVGARLSEKLAAFLSRFVRELD